MIEFYVELKHKNLDKPELLPATRKELTELYRPDIQQLETLIGRDLSHWLKTEGA